MYSNTSTCVLLFTGEECPENNDVRFINKRYVTFNKPNATTENAE